MVKFIVTKNNIKNIPLDVTHLIFDNDFNQPLIPGAIPNSVRHLEFGELFNQPLIPGAIPNKIV